VKEFEAEKEWWTDRKESKQAWKVSIDEIKNRNYNLDIKNPYEEIDHLESPDVILGKLEATEKKIRSIQEEIITVLNKALS
jgi:type I restriction enzyme M protein